MKNREALYKNATWTLILYHKEKKKLVSSIRVLLSLTINIDWPLQQLNVNNILLHGHLKKQVYTYYAIVSTESKSTQ